MKKRLLRYLRIAGLGLAVCAIAGLTVLLVAFGRGYSYDFQTHSIVRSGLLLVTSQPTGADVMVDGKPVHSTPDRVSLPMGDYMVTVSKPGYQPWRKQVQIVTSEVTFAQYVLLLPNKLPVNKLLRVGGTLTPVPSSDQKLIAYTSDTTNDDLNVVNTDGSDARKIWQAPSAGATSGTAPAAAITSVAWSDDDSHLLVTTVANGQSTVWVVAVNGSGATNLTDAFKFDFGQIVFAPHSWQDLYWDSPDGLRQVNLSNQTVSGVLADSVVQMSLSDEQLFYVQDTALGRQLMSIDSSGKKQQVTDTLSTSDSYSISADSYGGHSYVAVVPAQTHTATVYIDPYSQQPASKVISQDANAVLFSPDGRYLLASSDTGGTVYDIDRSNVTGSTVLYGLGTLTTMPQDYAWLDNYHLLYRSGNTTVLCEFDGGNRTTVQTTAVSAAWPLADEKSFDELAQFGGQQWLTQVVLRP